MKYDVAFAVRSGDTPEGGEWERFIQYQKELLSAYAEKGWSLIAAVPVTRTPGIMAGVLLYLASDRAQQESSENKV